MTIVPPALMATALEYARGVDGRVELSRIRILGPGRIEIAAPKRT